MKVAYLLDSFPNVSETFILDEVVCAREAGVACFVFSLARPSPQPVHADAQALLDAGLVEYHREPARPCKARALAG